MTTLDTPVLSTIPMLPNCRYGFLPEIALGYLILVDVLFKRKISN
ncbi:hypothetical protein M076_0116 [Bacteroides fragilis str. 2-F-2 |uniref:Uncharacterized protein n=1 Tax=Bacteroides fragilis str. 2-F-2 \|nr:hypothetical protein M077_0118 [Bacteroides fragilis str. 2-F-2 \